MFYSTPSCYLKSLNENEITWPTKEGDFFPYSSNFNNYWSGYYTSRSNLKFFERLGNNLLQVSVMFLKSYISIYFYLYECKI